MRKSIIFFFGLILLSCQTNKKESSSAEDENQKDKKAFEMYEMSEMAALMEQMYVDNKRLKERIEKGEDVGEFPNYFAKIHTSTLTDATDNDDFFQEQAAIFIANQKLIYTDPSNAKKHYSNAIESCIKCHEVKCSGPISRIKKLEF